jgi:hypothetical protein
MSGLVATANTTRSEPAPGGVSTLRQARAMSPMGRKRTSATAGSCGQNQCRLMERQAAPAVEPPKAHPPASHIAKPAGPSPPRSPAGFHFRNNLSAVTHSTERVCNYLVALLPVSAVTCLRLAALQPWGSGWGALLSMLCLNEARRRHDHSTWTHAHKLVVLSELDRCTVRK